MDKITWFLVIVLLGSCIASAFCAGFGELSRSAGVIYPLLTICWAILWVIERKKND